MLKIIDQEYFELVKAFAEKIGKTQSLQENLKFLEGYAIHGDDDPDKTICELYKDFAPYSFYFVMLIKTPLVDRTCAKCDRTERMSEQEEMRIREAGTIISQCPCGCASFITVKNVSVEHRRWFNGGLIFHGNHDGYGSGAFPTLSVCINPTDGWSIHT